MSAQSVYFDSFSHSAPRYANSAGKFVDVLGTEKHISLSQSVYPIKRELSADGSPDFAKTVIYKLPSSGYIHKIELKTLLAQTTTENYSDYPGAAIPFRIELRADNETLHLYNYAPAFQYYLSKLNNEEAIDKILLAAGGTNIGTAAATYVMTPIPTFFDMVMIKGARPLNLNKFRKNPELHVTFRSLADSVKATSTGGAITSAWIVCWMSETNTTMKNVHKNKTIDFHKSIDFYTNTNNSVAQNTETYIDISGAKGLLKRAFCTLTLDSTITAKGYLANVELSYLKTDFDGHVEWVFRQKEEGETDYIAYNHGKGFHSTLGYPYIVPFGYYGSPSYVLNNIGGLHSAKVHKNQLVVYQANAASNFDVLVIRAAIFKYIDGGMSRLL